MAPTTPSHVHRELAFWLMLLLAFALYLPRLTTLTIRGEESRRAVIAREMIETGDWVVPRTQGEVRLSRPPLQNWLIAVLAVLAGEMTTWSVRLPGVIATVATVGLVYWSARRTLSVTGATVAAAAYASFFQVLEQGGTGETEPVFTFFVAASLLAWHGLWKPRVCLPWDSFNSSKSPRESVPWASAWIIGGALAGLAMLTKGLQAPLYFFGSTWAYLIITRRHRMLFSRGHLFGILAFVFVVGLWQVAFISRMGLENGWLIYFRNVAHRFSDNRPTTWIVHFLTYPLAVVGGCLLPWSVLLLAFVDPRVRTRLRKPRECFSWVSSGAEEQKPRERGTHSDGSPWASAENERADQAVYLITCIIVCLPSVWLPPEARPRYFMPLFPCFAGLVGIAAEVLCELAVERPWRLWTAFIRTAIGLLAATAVAIPVTSFCWPAWEFAIPLEQGLVCGAALLIAVAVLHGANSMKPDASLQFGSVMIAAALGLIHVGPIITVQKQRSENLPVATAELRKELPANTRLVSFDHVHHVFLYYFGSTVERLPWPHTAADVSPDVDFFCVHMKGTETPKLPFPWDVVASLSVDRNHHDVPLERVVVGRRRANGVVAQHPDLSPR